MKQTKGIVLRRVKTTGARQILSIFTREYGKVSAGAYASSGAKNKSTAWAEPFTMGEYHLSERGAHYNVDKAETIRVFYDIGGDLDRFFAASYVLEITDRLLVERMPQPELFDILADFLEAVEKRKTKFDTLVIAYECKALAMSGALADLSECVMCGRTDRLTAFSVPGGGMICSDCEDKLTQEGSASLIFHTNFDIISTIKFLVDKPLRSLQGLALDESAATVLQRVIREYMAYHLDISGLKSESMFSGGSGI